MSKFRKIACLVIALVFVATMLIGCSQDELSVLNAVMKSTDITSADTKTDLTFNINAKGLPSEDQDTFDQISGIINGSTITIDQKMKKNSGNTVSTSQTDIGMNVMGMPIATTIWTDYDLTSAAPKMKTIIKIPPAYSMLLSSSTNNKPYLVMDVGKMLSEDKTSAAEIKQITQLSATITQKFKDFIKDYALQFDPGFPIITSKGETTVNGQSAALYNLKLDDTSFKNLLAYTVPNFAQSEKAMAFFKDLLNSITSIAGSDADVAEAKKELDEAFADYQKELPDALATWDKVMSALKDVKMLGDKGIDIDIAVNSDGYIVSEKGSVDVVIDLKAIADAAENISAIDDNSYVKKATTETGTVEISLDFNSTVSDINKNITISLPKLNAQNSMSLEEMMNLSTTVTKTPAKPVKRDTTAPGKPVVNSVSRTSAAVTGKAEAGSTIIVKKGKTVIGKGTTNSKGVFSVSIKPIKAKATLTVTATDKAGNVSKAATVVIK